MFLMECFSSQTTVSCFQRGVPDPTFKRSLPSFCKFASSAVANFDRWNVQLEDRDSCVLEGKAYDDYTVRTHPAQLTTISKPKRDEALDGKPTDFLK
uniref:Uncharacterized protein n=1 Tax=Ditylenchus dipsaci TaxID=166011 RepID=A0A915DHF1_9BILA